VSTCAAQRVKKRLPEHTGSGGAQSVAPVRSDRIDPVQDLTFVVYFKDVSVRPLGDAP
jgi:hypothetical protein